MTHPLIESRPLRPEPALAFVRIACALVLLVHPVHRLSHGNVPGFGEWLLSVGIPKGDWVAWAVTLLELAAGSLLVFRRLVVPACAVHITVLAMGIKMVHGPEGWFVVGGGRNGVEFSVLLIACLLGIAWGHLPKRADVI